MITTPPEPRLFCMSSPARLVPTLALLVCAGSHLVAADSITRGLRASFYSTGDLCGPVSLTRLDTRLSFNWGTGSPDPSLPSDQFSARWEGWLVPDQSGDWQLQGTADQAVRVWLDGSLIIDQWTSNAQAGRISPVIRLVAGSAHHLRIEYAEKNGNASVRVQLAPAAATLVWRDIPATWLVPSRIPVASAAALEVTGLAPATVRLNAIDADGDGLTWRIVTPPTRGTASLTADGLLTYEPTFHRDAVDAVVAEVTDGTHRVSISVPVTLRRLRGEGTGLAAAYFAGTNLVQPPALTRTDAVLAFDWKAGAADPVLPSDYFSARWTGYLVPTISDLYTLIPRTDDGVRVWLDDQLIIDRWVAQSVRDTPATPVQLEAGRRYALRVEYYERAGLAVARFDWSSPRTLREAIPADCLIPAPAPILAQASLAVTGIQPASIALQATDADSTNLTWRLVTPPTAGSATLTDAGILSYQATVNATGNDRLTVEVSDGTTPITLTVPITRTKLVGTGTGLAGAYFAGRNLEGLPLIERLDAGLNFAWSSGSPDSTVPVDRFSARWTGYLEPSITDTYTLVARMDDGVRVWVDDQLVIDRWLDQSARDHVAAPLTLEAGRRYKIRIEYYENAGLANARLSWSASRTPSEVIPATALHPAPALAINPASLAVTGLGQATTTLAAIHPTDAPVTWRLVKPPTSGSATLSPEGTLTYTSRINSDDGDTVVVEATDGHFPVQMTVPVARTHLRGDGTGLTGSYFAGNTLAGNPKIQRLDAGVGFLWKSGSPDPVVPSDYFSVRWTGWLTPVITDTYTLIAKTDNGVRLWLDGKLVIDRWNNPFASDVPSAPIPLEAGRRYQVRMEYRENTGWASAELAWSSSTSARVTIPADFLTPSLAPVVEATSLAVTGLAPASVALQATDADGDTLRFAVVAQPTYGQASISAAGVLTYQATFDGAGSDAVVIEVTDAWQATRLTVPVTRHLGNRAPVPASITGQVAEDGVGSLTLTAVDPEGDSLTWRLVAQPTIGTATVSAEGLLTFTPPANWAGSTTVEVAVADAQGAEAFLSIPWTVTPEADAARVQVVEAAVTEGVGVTLALTVQRVDLLSGAPLADNVALQVSLTADGNLASGVTSSLPTSVTIPAGSSAVTINLSALNDDVRTPRRHSLITPVGGTAATLSIRDDDGQFVLDRHLPGYQEQGAWEDDPDHAGWEGHGSRRTADASASVTYDVAPLEPGHGWYLAEVFRIADYRASTAIPYTIQAADGRFWTRLDHNPGGDARLATDGWVELGVFRLDDGPTTITVQGPPYGLNGHADAIRLTPVSGPRAEQVIDRGTMGYSEGSFWVDLPGAGHDGLGARTAEADDPWAWTSYNPTVAPGTYEVGFWAVTGPDSTAALAAEIHTADGPVTRYIDLTALPADGWVSLGTYDFEADDGLVVLFNGYPWGTLRADAVRFRAVVPVDGPTGDG